MHIGVVKDVGVQVEVVKALRGQHHAHIITWNQHSWLVTGKLACITGPGENLARPGFHYALCKPSTTTGRVCAWSMQTYKAQ